MPARGKASSHITGIAAQAARLRLKSNRLKAIIIVLPLALLLFNLAKGLHPSRRPLRYTAALLGTCGLVFAIAATLAVELLS